MNDITETEEHSSQARILVVDDDRTMRMMLAGLVENMGHEVIETVSGEAAIDILENGKIVIDIVLLDREMPGMDGLAVMARIKENQRLKNMPVIMVTGSNKPEQIREGLDTGVFYYLTKPIDQDITISVLNSAVRKIEQHKTLSSELKKHRASFNLIERCIFCFKTMAEAEHLAAFLAYCCPDPERVLFGFGKFLMNAVEHGNLGITYDEKTELIEQGSWRKEIERRQDLPEYKDRSVHVDFRRGRNDITVKITDQGAGFDWRRYLEVDPARAMDNHGRGIAQARAMSFDEIAFNEAGNEVTATVRNEEELEW